MGEIDVTKVTAIEYLEKLIKIDKEEDCFCESECNTCKYRHISCVSIEKIANMGVENHIKKVMTFETFSEPEIDWFKVKKDTLIEVRENEERPWDRRYFAKYQDGKIYTYLGGRTSKTEFQIIDWEFARLVEED